MAERASVESIDALKHFRRALWKFAEAANSALGDAEAELFRTLTWLETEQPTFWEHQIRKRQEIVARCKEAVRMKKLFKDATGRQQSAIEEEKALRVALRRLEVAEEKLALTKQYARRLQKEVQIYKGNVQRFATDVQSDIPLAVARLDNLVAGLEKYVAVASPELAKSAEMAGASAGAGGAGGAMTRAPAEPGQGHPLAALRKRTPDAAARGAATPGEPPTASPLPTLDAASTAIVALMNPSKLPPEAAERVIVERGMGERHRIYLERIETSPGQSQWYIGVAEDEVASAAPAQYEWLGVKELLEARPDWADLLAFAAGTLIVIGQNGLEVVLDHTDRDLLPARAES